MATNFEKSEQSNFLTKSIEIAKTIGRILPYIITFLLVSFVNFGAKILPKIDLETKDYVNITAVVFCLTYAYFDWLIREAPKLALRQVNHGKADDLRTCIESALEDKERVETIRIYALSTGYLHPMMQRFFLKRGFSENVLILLCDAEQDINYIPHYFSKQIKTKASEWKRLEKDKSIKTLKMWWYNFFPLDYFVLIDDSDLVFGRYIINREEPSFLQVREAYHFKSNTPLGKKLIQDYLMVFDNIITTQEITGVRLISEHDLK